MLHSRNLKPLLRSKNVAVSKPFAVIKEVNTQVENLKNIAKNEGIQKKLTSGYTPQQNGVSERRNRTIVEMVRTMMNKKRLQNFFWVEVVDTSIHILNRCPTKALKD